MSTDNKTSIFSKPEYIQCINTHSSSTSCSCHSNLNLSQSNQLQYNLLRPCSMPIKLTTTTPNVLQSFLELYTIVEHHYHIAQTLPKENPSHNNQSIFMSTSPLTNPCPKTIPSLHLYKCHINFSPQAKTSPFTVERKSNNIHTVREPYSVKGTAYVSPCLYALSTYAHANK